MKTQFSIRKKNKFISAPQIQDDVSMTKAAKRTHKMHVATEDDDLIIETSYCICNCRNGVIFVWKIVVSFI